MRHGFLKFSSKFNFREESSAQFDLSVSLIGSFRG